MSVRWKFEKAVRDEDLGLTTKGKVVGFALASRMDGSGQCDPGIERIMADTGLGETAVREGRDELVHAGLLQVTLGGGRAAGGGGRTSLHQALATPRVANPCEIENSSPTPRVANPSPHNPLRGEPEDLEQDLGLKVKSGLEQELDVTSSDASRAREVAARHDPTPEEQAALFDAPHPGAYSEPDS